MNEISEPNIKLPIMEIFGPTIQGEGMVAGQKTIFVRTYGCDYKCDWCDSKFTWDGSQKPSMLSVKKIMDEINNLSDGIPGHVTISGGNPAILKKLSYLIDILSSNNYKIGLETQGSIWQDWFYKIDDLTISPKPPSSKMETNFEILKMIVEKLETKIVNYSIKIVIFNENDLEYAKNIKKLFSHFKPPLYLQVGNSDVHIEGDITTILLNKYSWLCEKVIEDSELNDIRVLPQIHTLIWGNKQGV